MHPELMNNIATQKQHEIHVVASKAALARRARATRATVASRLRDSVSDTLARGWPTSSQPLVGRRSALRV
jgi:hypothetical protein